MYRDRCGGEGVVTVIHMFLLYQSDTLSHYQSETYGETRGKPSPLRLENIYSICMLWEISLIKIVKRRDLYPMTQFLFFSILQSTALWEFPSKRDQLQNLNT